MGLAARMQELGIAVVILDGDRMRRGLNAYFGFSPVDREENIRRVREVTCLFVEAGVMTITACISPPRAGRDAARKAAGGRPWAMIVARPGAGGEFADMLGEFRLIEVVLTNADGSTVTKKYVAPGLGMRNNHATNCVMLPVDADAAHGRTLSKHFTNHPDYSEAWREALTKLRDDVDKLVQDGILAGNPPSPADVLEFQRSRVAELMQRARNGLEQGHAICRPGAESSECFHETWSLILKGETVPLPNP